MATNSSLYVKLANELTSDIRERKYEIGEVLPTEGELAEQYGLSRHTVRAALNVLADARLIQKRHGVGSVVIAHTPSPMTGRWTTVQELLDYGRASMQEILDVKFVQLDERLLELAGSDPEDEWLEVTLLRYVRPGSQSHSYSAIYVNPRYSRIVEDTVLPGARGPFKQPIFRLVEKAHGIRATEVEQVISAVSLKKGVADHLEARSGSPGLRLIRKYTAADATVLEVSVTYFVGDRYDYSMRLDISDR